MLVSVDPHSLARGPQEPHSSPTASSTARAASGRVRRARDVEAVDPQMASGAAWSPLAPEGGVAKRLIRAAPEGAPLCDPFKEVRCHYVGTCLGDAEPFDSSRARGAEFKFMLGVGAVIPAWDIGFQQMRVGELCELKCDAKFAYGDEGREPGIKPGATLIFEIEVLGCAEKQKELHHMTAEEKLNEATKHKAKGLECFSKEDWRGARKEFAEAVNFCDEQFYKRNEGSEQGAPWPAALRDTYVSCYMNMSQCVLKEHEWPSAAAYATKALAYSPGNVKALYRRAFARSNMGLLEEAKVDLLHAAKLEPKNVSVRQLYADLKKKFVSQKSAQRSVFASAFDRVDLFPEKPSSVSNPSRTTNPYVFLDFHVDRNATDDGAAAGAFAGGTVVLRVFADACPRTARNFVTLAGGKGKRSYKNCAVVRVEADFMVQAGDVISDDGSGGESIYGPTFADEHFRVPHDKAGVLSMANTGPDSNASQFFITTRAVPHLDGKHVAFGNVVSGQHVVDAMSRLEADEDDQPKGLRCFIARCGALTHEEAMAHVDAEKAAQTAVDAEKAAGAALAANAPP
ncbi:hypothetical protein M885DRAFT_509530 [Pelagophyceae sp. CCMP2097]|nr:hypothetical protein M885DRAFT_509530 [Pelagophyceae sp. CCMP2097]|mmetsp:Transcript_10891/g.37768  ORF Transcript_10891/g.37768 Transcript_10891/m.37768 type:complete len:570 (+) Transcript_10891:1-1710(+)